MTLPTHVLPEPKITQDAAARAAEIQERALSALSGVSSREELEEWRIAFLGRGGEITRLKRGIAEVPPDQRRDFGRAANEAAGAVEAAFEERRAAVHERAGGNSDAVDVTLPGRPSQVGGIHPVTATMREICSAFSSMGFEIVEGPEVELDRYNFEMLNIPRHHPARDSFNTLWLDQTGPDGEPPLLLRTHTSPMQVRTMQGQSPPVRVVVPGKVYRYEATDATHEWHFTQVEGLAVDKGITFGDLKGTLYEFARRLFGEDVRARFRCDYFPFVEPGAEMAIEWNRGNGSEDARSEWIEILGAGMVHPNVLSGVGYDPAIYTGFAFGIGVERIAMLRHGIDDIRLFYANDLRFLRQFS